MRRKNPPVPSTSMHLFISRGYVLLGGAIPETSEHSHYAVEVFIDFEEPVSVVCGRRSIAGNVVVIGSDTPHWAAGSPSGSQSRRVILMLDADSVAAKSVKDMYLRTEPAANVTGLVDSAALKRELTDLDACSAGSVQEIYRRILGRLTDVRRDASAPDRRIFKAQEFLNSARTKKVPLSDLAREINLSEGRLIHLFKEQVGIPIRRYQLWLRLIDSVKCVLEGRSLTEAAHEAGFSDYAHLSRTFTRMFGYSLSDIFKSEASVQIVPGSGL